MRSIGIQIEWDLYNDIQRDLTGHSDCHPKNGCRPALSATWRKSEASGLTSGPNKPAGGVTVLDPWKAWFCTLW